MSSLGVVAVQNRAEERGAVGRQGPSHVLLSGTEEPGGDCEEGQGGGVHERHSGSAHVRLQQRRRPDTQDARGRQLRFL